MLSFYTYIDSLSFSNFYWDFYYVLNGSFINSSILFSTWFFLLLFIGLSELSIVSILFLAESNMFTPIVFLVFFITIEFTAVLFLLNAIAMEAVIGVSVVLNYIKGWGFKMFSFHELLESSLNLFKTIYRLTPRRFKPANIWYFFIHFINLPSKNVLGWPGFLRFKLLYAVFLTLFLAFFFFNFNAFFSCVLQSKYKNEFLYFETLLFSINFNLFSFILKNQNLSSQIEIPFVYDFITNLKKHRISNLHTFELKQNPTSHLRFYFSIFSYINSNNFVDWRNISPNHSNSFSLFKGLSGWLEFSNNFNVVKNSLFIPNSGCFKKNFNNAELIEYPKIDFHFNDNLYFLSKKSNYTANYIFSLDLIGLKSNKNKFFFNNNYNFTYLKSSFFNSYGILNFLLNNEISINNSPYFILKKKSKKKLLTLLNFNAFLSAPKHISRNVVSTSKVFYLKNKKQDKIVNYLTTKYFNSYQDKNNSNTLMFTNNHPWGELSDDSERVFDKSNVEMYTPYVTNGFNSDGLILKNKNDLFLNLHLNSSLNSSKLELMQMYPINVLSDMSSFNSRLYNTISGVNHHSPRSKNTGWTKYDPSSTFLLRKDSNFIRMGANYTNYTTLSRTLINNHYPFQIKTDFYKNNKILKEIKPNIRLFTYGNSLFTHNLTKINLPTREIKPNKRLKQKSFYSKTSGFDSYFLKKISTNKNFLSIDSYIDFFKNTDSTFFENNPSYGSTGEENNIKFNIIKKRFNLLKKKNEKYFFSRAINPLVIKKESNVLFSDKPINVYNNVKAIPKSSKYSIIDKLQSSTFKPQTVYGLIWNEFLKNSYGTDVSFLNFSSNYGKYPKGFKSNNILKLENDIVSDLNDSLAIDFRYSLSTSDEIMLTTLGKYLPYIDIPTNFFSESGEKFKKSAKLKQELFSKLKTSNLIFRDNFKKSPINGELQFSFKNEKLIPVYENPYKKAFNWSNNEAYKNEFLKYVATNPSWLKKNNPDNFFNQSRIQYLNTHSFDDYKNSLFSESDFKYSYSAEVSDSKPFINSSKINISSVSDKSIIQSGLLDVRDFWLQKRNNLRFKLLSFAKNNQNYNQWGDFSSIGSDRFFDIYNKKSNNRFFRFKKEYGAHNYLTLPYIKFYRSRSRIIDKISKDNSIRFLKKQINGFSKTPYNPYYRIPTKKRYSLYSENNQLGFVNDINKTNRTSNISTLSYKAKGLFRVYNNNINIVSSIGEFFNSYAISERLTDGSFSFYKKHDISTYCYKEPSVGLFEYYFIRSLATYRNIFYYPILVRMGHFSSSLFLDFLFNCDNHTNPVYNNIVLVNNSIRNFSLAKYLFLISEFSNIIKYFTFYSYLFFFYFF